AICQANCTGLPGYDGPVLRIRFMLFAPDYDFGEKDLDDYGMLLADLFLGVIELSEDVLQARYVKIHLRSPADRQFFTILGRGLEQSDHFDSVHVKGAW